MSTKEINETKRMQEIYKGLEKLLPFNADFCLHYTIPNDPKVYSVWECPKHENLRFMDFVDRMLKAQTNMELHRVYQPTYAKEREYQA